MHMSVRSRLSEFPGVISVLMLALLWLLPFSLPDHKVPIGTFWQEWTAVSLLALALISGLIQSTPSRRYGMPKITLALFGLAAVIALQFAIGLLNFTSNLIIPLLYLGTAVLACMLGNTIRQNGELETLGLWIAVACVVGGIFTVQVQLAQWLGIDHAFPFMSAPLSGQRPFGNINQSNHAAAYLSMALASVLCLRSTGRISLTSTGLAALILTTGLVLTGQRSALVYTLMPLALTSLAWRTLPDNRRTLLQLGLALPALFIAINLLLSYLAQNTTVPMEALKTKTFYDDRANLWQHSWVMFMQHPLLGVGFDQYWPQFFEQLDTLYGELAPNHPHNLVAALLAETGLAGAAIVGIPLALWLWRVRQPAMSWVQWLGLIQLLIIGFHSLIEYPLWYSYFLVIAAFWLGACDTSAWTFKLQRPRLASLLVLLATVPALTDVALSYQKFRTKIWSVPHPNIITMAEFRPTQPQTLNELSGHWFFHREVLFWQPDTMLVSSEDLEAKIALNREAMKIAPSSGILFRQVLLLVLNGQVEEAAQLLHRAKQIFPERYRSMQEALPLAAKKWPQQFEPVMRKLLEPVHPATSQAASAGPKSR